MTRGSSARCALYSPDSVRPRQPRRRVVASPRIEPTDRSVLPLAGTARGPVVFSFPLGDEGPSSLTATERHVVLLMLCGFRDRQIAALRETSLKTVTKQVEAAYRKLGVRSRAELAAKYSLQDLGAPGPARGRRR